MSAAATRYTPRANDLAIVGMAVRVPGARNVEEFWANLRAGREAITFFTDEELRTAGIDAALLARKTYVKANAVLPDADRFDAGFFGYTPREAELLDVQQRVLLECAWTALEHAGYDPLAIEGACGVYAGAGLNTYLLRQIAKNPAAVASAGGFQVMIANDKDFLATRIAYKLNLRGPSLAVQTACSTSLVAVHLAGQSLLAGECDVALAGGVSIRVPQHEGYEWQEGMILSPDGHCRAFDAKAAGTIGGNGAGLVVLKRVEDALAAGDTIHAIVRGSAINNDGAGKIGYTAPGLEGQENVIAEALAVAGVTPDEIGYVEAHGTGTPLGDPIEVAALTRAFRRGTERKQFCALGSLKTNVGHLDAAAGVAGLIKAALVLKHGEIPASLHFETPNPQIDFTNSPFRVAVKLTPWPTVAGGAPRRAGVSSFGIGGTNAHVVLEEPPAVERKTETVIAARPELFVVSARSESALARVAENLATALTTENFSDAAYTLAAGRRAFAFRRAVVARDAADAARRLRENVSLMAAVEKARGVAFLFPGQGTQYPGMGAGLYRAEPVFRAAVDRCAGILAGQVDFDVRALLLDEHGDARALAQTAVAQPALFTLSYALAQLWESRGVVPRAMLGHSIGEWVAACLAEVFTLEEALRLVVARARTMAAQPAGAMLAVGLAEAETRPLLGAALDVAAVNAPTQTVVAGPEAAIAQLEATLTARGVATTRLQTSHAYHSAMMEPAARALTEAFRGVPRRKPARRWISNVTGTWIAPDEAGDPAYWARHLRGTVRFADGLATLLAEPELLLLEVGAGRTLAGLAARQPKWTPERVAVAALRGGREKTDDATADLQALGQLWSAGAAIDWSGVYAARVGRRVPLPTYPFAGERYWIDAAPVANGATPAADARAKKSDVADWFYLPSWQRTLPLASLPAVTDGEWLLLADELGLAAKIETRLRALGARVTVANGAVDATAFAQARWIVSLREVSRTDNGEAGFAQLCDWGRQLSEAKLVAGARLTVVANGLHVFAGEQASHPAKALLHGPARVLPKEVPGLAARVVDIVWPGAAESADDLIDALLAEARGGEGEFVALRGGERWRQVAESVRIEPPATSPLRERGVYLVTGGLGGIGLVLAEDFAQRVQARLVLIGRSAPSPEAAQRIEALRSRGAEVMVACADVTDEAALVRVRAEAKAKFGVVHGIVHAAGAAGGGALARRMPAERAAVLAPKVAGTRALLRAFGGEKLDFFVLMSSLTAQLGEFGQSDYAAANAYLDACATERRRAGVPMLAIAWDAWRDTGMAARFTATGALAAWQQSEQARRIANAEGVEAFHRALGSGVAHVIVSTSDLAARWALEVAQASLPASDKPAGGQPALRKHRRPELAEKFVAPTTAAERAIAAIWEELLGVEAVGINDNFFELGGHSLLATQVIARLRESGAAGLTLATFFETPTIAALARSTPAGAGEAEPLLQPVPRDGVLPLSYAQQALWLLDRMEGSSAHYNEFGAQRIRGPLDPALLARALTALVARHEALRTRFVEGTEGARQEIAPPFAVELPVEVLNEAALPARAQELTAQPFDLARGPLLRARVVRLGADDHVLMVVVHHIVFDGWSAGLFFRETIAGYEALARGAAPELPPLTVQYADFAAWQRTWLSGARHERLLAFWRGQLAGKLPVLALPTDRPRPKAQTFRGRKLALAFDRALTERIEALGRAHGASLFMTLLAGYAALLGRTAAQEDVIVGCPTAGRDRRELEPLIGFFINPLALRVNLAGNPRFAELLERVKTTVVAAYAHAALPFEQVVEAVHPPRDPARSAIFQAMFIFQNAVAAPAAAGGLTIEPWETADGPARSDLDLYLWETATGVRGYFIYNAALFAEPAVQRLATRLRALFEAVTAAPATRLAEVRLDATSSLPRLATRLAKLPSL